VGLDVVAHPREDADPTPDLDHVIAQVTVDVVIVAEVTPEVAVTPAETRETDVTTGVVAGAARQIMERMTVTAAEGMGMGSGAVTVGLMMSRGCVEG